MVVTLLVAFWRGIANASGRMNQGLERVVGYVGYGFLYL